MKFEIETKFNMGDEVYVPKYDSKQRKYSPQRYFIRAVRANFTAYVEKQSGSVIYTLNNHRKVDELYVRNSEEECQDVCDMLGWERKWSL